jgi:hypothetical protein
MLFGCGEPEKAPSEPVLPVAAAKQEPLRPRPLSEPFREYWYAGVAEVSSYALQQARYGELRDGEAVLIYVTEPFNLQKQVKADRDGEGTASVLKLNRVGKFLTGVYPYSLMSSIFYPVADTGHALKITTSIQEWCGHVYMQLNNRDSFEVQSHSYFEGEADQSLSLPKSLLEDELWTRLRFRPDSLPTGTHPVVPSLEFLRLKHQPVKAYTANLTLSEPGPHRTYTLTYPELNRTLQIHFGGDFPYPVEGWTETTPSGFRPDGPMITTTARRKETLRTPYWQKNSNADVSLRDSLGLHLP